MTNKRGTSITILRVLHMLILLVLLYRKESLDVFFTAITLFSISFWVLPAAITGLIFRIFKIEDKYAGTLLYDDSDITNCKFRMVFNFEPEDLIKESTFVIKTERANLIYRDENKD